MSLYICPNTKCTTSRVIPNVNYGLWLIMLCPRRFIRGKTRVFLGNGTDNRGRYARNYACVGWKGIGSLCTVLFIVS